MTARPDYIGWLRSYVGHQPVLLNFAAACVIDDGRVLLQLRDDDGRWGFPGGAVELGESVEEAVRREVHEETGYLIAVERLLGVYTKYSHTYPNGDVAQPMTTFFVARPADGPRDQGGSETQEIAWWPLDEVPPLMSPQHEDALSDLRDRRSGVYR